MIVKVLGRHDAGYVYLINYILQKNPANERNVILHNLRSDNLNGWMQEFMQNEAFRNVSRSDQLYFYHEILSFSSNENNALITDEVLRDIAEQYIKLRGEQGMYLGSWHRDVDHAHIHFITSALEYCTGKAFRLSKEALQDVKIQLQEYHKAKYPEIEHSECNHGSGKPYVTDRAWYAKHKDARAALKEQLTAQVQQAFAEAKSQKQFIELLREQNLHHYERGNAIAGIMHENTKFRFSRFDIDLEQLPIDRTEEQKALDEISALRQQMTDRSRTIENELIR
jgi:hypothetical protein